MIAAACAAAICFAQPWAGKPISDASSLEEFLPVKNVKFNPAVPTPQQFFGFNPGESFVDWNGVLMYMHELERTSARVSLERFGSTFEGRQFVRVVITSPENQKNLEQIRLQHLKLTDVSESASLDIDRMPVVVDIMASIHGNEASGVGSVMISAYYFAAAEDDGVKDLLSNTVVVFVPGLNPDGINRFASWANSRASENRNADNNSWESNEASPSGRSNHYWNDCNRDWLNLQFPEAGSGVATYLKWMPNVVLDLHEQWSAKRGFYYFSPGDPNRTHKYIPQRNQDLTKQISKATKAAFDSMQVACFTERGYDDFYIGKGAAYGDVQGSVCLLHEETGSRGHALHTARGDIDFAFTVRNQSVATVTLVYRSCQMKKSLLEYQRDFYRNAARAAASDPSRGYVFDARGNRGIEYHILDNLTRHEIDVYKVAGEEGRYAVPFDQKHYYKIKCLFEDITSYRDTVFYDISTWTLPRAFDLNYSLEKSLPPLGEKVSVVEFPKGRVIGGSSDYGYAFETGEYYSPRMMSDLQKQGVNLTVAKEPFTYSNGKNGIKKKTFPTGTIVVALKDQRLSAAELYDRILACATRCGVDVYALQSESKLKDFSLSFINRTPVRVPKVAILVGTGAKGGFQKLGQLWYLLDYRYAMNHTIVHFDDARRSSFKFSDYNTILIYGEMPKMNDVTRKMYASMQKWLNDGGTLVLYEKGASFTSLLGMPKIEKIGKGSRNISGVILNATASDEKSPLLWGYDHYTMPVFKMSDGIWSVPEEASVVMEFSQSPYLSGWMPDGKDKEYEGAPVVMTIPNGQGHVIFFAEDMNFRSYWLGTSHLLTNAIFFADKLR